MLLMKIDWSQPLSFQRPPGTKYSTHGWVLVDDQLGNYTADQILKYAIHEILDPTVIADLQFINYTVLDDGSVALTSTVGDHTDAVESQEDHMQFFPKIDPANEATFLAGYKYIANLEIQMEYDKRFAALGPVTSNLEAASFNSQLAEAQAVQSNPNYPTPLLSSLSAASGLSVADLAASAVAKNSAYQDSINGLLGKMLADKQAVQNSPTALQVKQLGWI